MKKTSEKGTFWLDLLGLEPKTPRKKWLNSKERHESVWVVGSSQQYNTVSMSKEMAVYSSLEKSRMRFDY